MMTTHLHPIPAPRTPKGREVARSNLEAASATTTASSESAGGKSVDHNISRLERILMASRNEDLNLAALITAVERDIWYMEQLESNPSVLRRKNSPDELPFPITDELIKLPGYKPKVQAPLLPPKNTSSRQRRHSDTVSSITDSIVQAEQRKSSVSNALYDTRCMDSPPPNPLGLHHPDSSTSDLSSNTTSEDSVLKRLNCPLCTNTFGYSFGLECHLLSVHQESLQAIRDGQRHLSCCGCLCCAAQFVKVETLVKHLLEDHRDFLLNSLSPMIGFQSDFASDFEDSSTTTSLKRHFDCQFCGQKFLRRHKKLFMVHLEQKHLKELEIAIRGCNLALFNISQHVENLEVKLLQNLSSKVRIMSSNPDQDLHFHRRQQPAEEPTLIKTKDRSKKRRSISAQRVKSDRILDSDFQFIDAYEKISPPHHYETIVSPPILTSTMKRLKKKLKRSESSAQTSTKWPQNNGRNFCQNKAADCAVNLSQRFIKLSTYKSVPQPEPSGNSEEDDDERTSSTNSMIEDNHHGGIHFSGNLFKCNLCEIAFAENAFLLTHLKNRHRSTVSKALKPHFSCGACPAKFFKNSFLVKHCECHEKIR